MKHFRSEDEETEFGSHDRDFNYLLQDLSGEKDDENFEDLQIITCNKNI